MLRPTQGRRAAPADPPRAVPLTLAIQLLFGGVGQLGWSFIGLGAALAAVFVPGLNWDPLLFHGPRQLVWARVLDVEETGFTRGAGPAHHPSTALRDGRRTHAYTFEYEDRAGVARRATSYGGSGTFAPGGRAQVEYLERNPNVARILGQHRGPVPLWVAVFAVFPILGIGFAIYRARKGLRALGLLRTGRVAAARLVARERLDMHIDQKWVHRLTFEYHDDAGQPQTRRVDTHEPRRLTNERAECLLYDPRRPDRAVLLDELPVRIRIDEHSGWCSVGVSGWAMTAAPLLALAACAAAIAMSTAA